MHHLRRFAKSPFLPQQIKDAIAEIDEFPAETDIAPSGISYILVSPPVLTPENLELFLSKLAPYTAMPEIVEGISIPVQIPVYPPESDAQAKRWSAEFWPCGYNQAAHPASYCPPVQVLERMRGEVDLDAKLKRDLAQERVSWYMALAKRAAQEAEEARWTDRDGKERKMGRGVGVVVVDPIAAATLVPDNADMPLQHWWERGVVAVAGDTRWWQPPHYKHTDLDDEGHPTSHAILRAISLIALRRTTTATTGTAPQSSIHGPKPIEIETPPHFAPLSALEAHFITSPTNALRTRHGGGYLCNGLDMYVWREPCVGCGMGAVHSRFRSITIGGMKPRQGSECEPDTKNDCFLGAFRVQEPAKGERHGKGYGLHWRRELNWRSVGWEFSEEAGDPIDNEFLA